MENATSARTRFSQLNLTTEPLLASDGSAGNFFEQAAAAIEACSGSQPDAAAASSDGGTDEDAAKAQALLAGLAEYLGKFPEALRSVLRTWIGARLSGGDQVVSKAADERLHRALVQLVQGGSRPPHTVETGLVGCSDDGALEIHLIGEDNKLKPTPRAFLGLHAAQLSSRPLLSNLLRRVRTRHVHQAADDTDLDLLYVMLADGLLPYAGQARRRRRRTTFPRGRVYEERRDITVLLTLLEQLRRAASREWSDEELLSATEPELAREARHALLPGTTTRSAVCALAARNGPLTLGWAPVTIEVAREWLMNDVGFQPAVINGASVDALEGFMVIVLEAEGGSLNMRLHLTAVLRALGASVTSPLITTALEKIDTASAGAATATEIVLRAAAAFDGSTVGFCRWASRRFAGNMNPRAKIPEESSSLLVDATLVLAALSGVEDEEEQEELVAAILREAQLHCGWALPAELSVATESPRAVASLFVEYFLSGWAEGESSLGDAE
ncbi:hypothetical protein EMIHUDRAFT_449809 [Emiliania huxleyi CCMP1516]|uniref:Uncharacterized protein n=2 Tax=Emiliania huxleyi TaxID=2903 RepID=A0A0D3K0B3_EMIH1|nr:hypothetical protein EMIHUDRAFT_449809 [Emiliania huxleyi CCMP1516]EOD29198.1 hypothetical protein EMIHUDRAFT_449809 [Emiliania huxleyi CCMP1516]|eukprot:XP_005781627.1 hypothetical protein EMIHUDRAFT_449809 [Emiliania huxleyi CCMP1516]